jgi:hypothetical protein
MPLGGDAPEIGRDHLDSVAAPPRRRWSLPARRAALGLSPTAAPALTFVLVGIALGPVGLGALSPAALIRLDPVVSVALAALGIYVGLGLGAMRSPGASSLLFAATIEAGATIAVVSGVMYVLLLRWAVPLTLEPGLFALVLGISSCASAALRPANNTNEDARRAARIVDMDDVPLVLLGTLVVAAAARAPIMESTLLAIAASLAVGAAGWLLFERARSAAERGVFVTGAVLLLGGIGAYLGTSPLLSGCAAALVWVRTPGAADRIIGADLQKLQHPLVALLLIVAGASIRWDLALLWIAAPLVLLRLTGKLIAAAVAARVVGIPTGLLATVLVPPGVLGVALALNVQQTLGMDDTLLLSGVVVAAGAAELLSALLPEEPEGAR